MKIDVLNNTADEPQGLPDATLENISLSGESDSMDATGDIKVIQELKEKLANAEQKNILFEKEIKLNEASIKDKNDLIKSLNKSIELMNQNKELMFKQLKDKITDLQNTLDLSKNCTINENDAKQVKSAEFKKKTTENSLLTLQKQFEERQCASLANNIKIKAEVTEFISTLKAKSTAEEDKPESTIAHPEKKAKIEEVELKEKDAKIGKSTSNVFLNQSKLPYIKFVNRKMPPLLQDSLSAGADWMVIFRRFNGSQDFSMNSYSYEKGFGEVSGEFWLGLESLHELTTSRKHEMYIEMLDLGNETYYAKYDNFVVASKGEGYALKSLGAYSGNAGNALQFCMSGTFVIDPTRNYYWWSSQQNFCCLTGKYRTPMGPCFGGMYWYWIPQMCSKAPFAYSVKACQMVIRPI